MLAAVSAGVFDSLGTALDICAKRQSVTEPNPDNREAYDRLYRRYKAVHDALAPIYDEDI